MSSFSNSNMEVVQENPEKTTINDEEETLMDESEEDEEETNDENDDSIMMHTDTDALARFQIIVDPQLTHAKKEHYVLTCFWRKIGRDILQMSSTDLRKKLDLAMNKTAFSDALMRSTRVPPGRISEFDKKDDSNVFKLKPLVKPNKQRLPIKGPGVCLILSIQP